MSSLVQVRQVVAAFPPSAKLGDPFVQLIAWREWRTADLVRHGGPDAPSPRDSFAAWVAALFHAWRDKQLALAGDVERAGAKLVPAAMREEVQGVEDRLRLLVGRPLLRRETPRNTATRA